jgi:hypothetical protein
MGRGVWRAVVVAAGFGAACGGEGRNLTAPQTQAPPVTGLAAGAMLTVVSGATAAPLAGVSLTIGGQGVATDGAGQARVPAAARIGTLIDLTHASHLDRQSSVRTTTGERFTLWPRTTADGLDENYTATIVYTESSGDEPVGTSPLYRLPPDIDTVVVVPSAELLADGAAMEAHAAAARNATDATGGRVRVLLSASTPAGGRNIVVTSRVDASDPKCQEDRLLRGYMRGSYGSFVVLSGQIVYCRIQVARSATVTHELGHAFGLNHAPRGTNDVMEPTFTSGRAESFGPRESLVMRMMLDRTPGNRFPDSDRTIGASSVRERVTVCR